MAPDPDSVDTPGAGIELHCLDGDLELGLRPRVQPRQGKHRCRPLCGARRDAPRAFPDVVSHGPKQQWNGGSLDLEAFGWQPANRFATNAVDDSPLGAGGHAFLMAATCSTPVGDGTATWSVPQLGHRQLETGSPRHGTYRLADLADEVDALFHGPLVGSEAHIGVVFHVVEYERSPRLWSPASLPGMGCADHIDCAFDLLARRAAAARTASAILGDAVRAGLVGP